MCKHSTDKRQTLKIHWDQGLPMGRRCFCVCLFWCWLTSATFWFPTLCWAFTPTLCFHCYLLGVVINKLLTWPVCRDQADGAVCFFWTLIKPPCINPTSPSPHFISPDPPAFTKALWSLAALLYLQFVFNLSGWSVNTRWETERGLILQESSWTIILRYLQHSCSHKVVLHLLNTEGRRRRIITTK